LLFSLEVAKKELSLISKDINEIRMATPMANKISDKIIFNDLIILSFQISGT